MKLAAGNWKMNGLRADGVALAADIAARASRHALACEILICPPATLLDAVHAALGGSVVALGGQNCNEAAAGAHTGEIGAAMLKDVGCRYVILGHSERRADNGEDDALVCKKAAAARAVGLVPIVCVGETAGERDSGAAVAVVTRQLEGSLPTGLSAAELVIAYEPVWAIGTGRTATAAQVAEMHALIRQRLSGRVGEFETVRILYGGSVKPANAKELMNIANVDGALVGGASLVAADFWEIARACAGL